MVSSVQPGLEILYEILFYSGRIAYLGRKSETIRTFIRRSEK
jgi:hypothetical protein